MKLLIVQIYPASCCVVPFMSTHSPKLSVLRYPQYIVSSGQDTKFRTCVNEQVQLWYILIFTIPKYLRNDSSENNYGCRTQRLYLQDMCILFCLFDCISVLFVRRSNKERLQFLICDR
jgi:hypothetical protein